MSPPSRQPAPQPPGAVAPDVLDELEDVLRQRRHDAPAGSYSATLLADPERAARKIMEESHELVVELLRGQPDDERIAAEAADLVFHLIAGLVGAGVRLDAVRAELARRRAAGRAGEGQR